MTHTELRSLFSWKLMGLQIASHLLLFGIFVGVWRFISYGEKPALIALVALPVARSVVSFLALRETCGLTEEVAKRVVARARERFLIPKTEHRTLYRRLQQLFDFSASREELAANASAIVVVFCGLLAFVGAKASAVVITVVAGVLLAHVLQRASVRAFDMCNRHAARRNEEINKILSLRETLVGVPERAVAATRELNHVLLEERRWRALDSALKVGEMYLGMLLKLLPFAIVLGAVAAGLYMQSQDARLILWMTIPLVASILALPRQVQSAYGLSDAVRVIMQQTQDRSAATEVVVFGDSQRVWTASLGANILGTSAFHWGMLKELGLCDEIGLTRRLRPYALSLDPERLSEGQKQRLLLVRAVSLAIRLGRRLEIRSSLHALDDRNRARAVSLLNRLVLQQGIQIDGIEKIGVTGTVESSEPSESNQPRKLPNIMLQEPRVTQTVWVTRLMLFALPIFVFAGILDALVTDRLNASGSLDALSAWIAVAAFLIAIGSGVALEDLIRRKVGSNLRTAIFDSSAPTSEISKAVPVDLDTTFEGLSFYAHDLTWAIALFVVFACSALLGSGIHGLVTVVPAVAVLALLYARVYRPIAAAREAYLSASRRFAGTLPSLGALDGELRAHAQVARISRTRGTLAHEPFASWIAAKINVISLKGRLGIGLDLGFQIVLAIGLAVFMSANSASPAVSMAFFVAALLSVQKEASRLFVAVSGVLTTIASFGKIDALKELTGATSILWELNPASFKLNASTSRLTGITYDAHEFTAGATWIVGPSGSGKSTLLVDLFWQLRGAGRQSIYLRRANADASGADWLIEVMERPGWSAGACMILDEATTNLTRSELEALAYRLHNWALAHQVIVLLVDHGYGAHLAGEVYRLRTTDDVA